VVQCVLGAMAGRRAGICSQTPRQLSKPTAPRSNWRSLPSRSWGWRS